MRLQGLQSDYDLLVRHWSALLPTVPYLGWAVAKQ